MFLIILLFTILLIASIILIVDWTIHISQIKDFCETYGYTNYSNFIKEFYKYNWNQHGWSNSLFDYSTKSEIHANIIQFENKGMIMRTPIDYLWMNIFVRRYIKQTFRKKRIIKWN